MKTATTLFAFVLLLFTSAYGQDKKPLSPPMALETSVEGVDVVINYNAPSMRGRDIFGDLVPYDKLWRTGANESTKITFSSDAKVEGESIAAGTYSLFTIPGKDSWTVIFNSVADQWGGYSYKEENDVLRVSVTPMTMESKTETMTFSAEENGIGLMWEDQKIVFQISK